MGPLAAAVIPAAIGAGGSLLGGLFGRKSKPPEPPDYTWLKKYGPASWNKLYGEANNLIDNPYGIPQDIRNRMYSTARNTAEAGYGAAQRGIDRSTALSGLSPGGGEASRQRYYAGQQMAEGLNQAYSGIDVQDYLAREDQKNRGYNMLFSLSNKNPIYSQLVSQNYWNSLQANDQMWGQFGQAAGNLSQSLLDYYGEKGQGGNTGFSPYAPNPGNPYQQHPADNPYDNTYNP